MASPSKLFSCVDSDSILKSQINTSVSKMNWTFSKSNRFAKTKQHYCDKVYDVGNTKHLRSTSFGFGKRSRVEIEGDYQEKPPANRYKIDSFADVNKKRNMGFGLGKGRDETQSQGIYFVGTRKNNPGPGAYCSLLNKTEVPQWSMGSKTMSQWDIRTQVKNKPGPGAYKQIPMNPQGRYSLSHYKNSLSTTWNPKRSSRFQNKSVDIPGPGSYNPQYDDISSSGEFILSKNTSYGCRKILKSKRQGFIDQIKKRIKTPGPGAYRLPSDFGIYDHISEGCSHSNRSGGFANQTRSQILQPKNI